MEVTLEPRGVAARSMQELRRKLEARVIDLVTARLRAHGPLTLVASVDVGFALPGADAHLQGISSGSKLQRQLRTVLHPENARDVVAALFDVLASKIEGYEGRGSGLTVKSINKLTVKMARFKAFAGRGYIQLQR